MVVSYSRGASGRTPHYKRMMWLIPQAIGGISSPVIADGSSYCGEYSYSPPEKIADCADECCRQESICFADGRCTASGDYPNATGDSCAVCNARFARCIGTCVYSEVMSVAPYPGTSSQNCTTVCASHDAVCGAPDGCGGYCDGRELCGLIVRRPEFLTIF